PCSSRAIALSQEFVEHTDVCRRQARSPRGLRRRVVNFFPAAGSEPATDILGVGVAERCQVLFPLGYKNRGGRAPPLGPRRQSVGLESLRPVALYRVPET